MLRNKRVLWSVLIVIIAAASAGYYYYAKVYAPGEVPEEPTMQTATVRRGDLVIFASGVGTIVPASEIGLGFPKGGELIEVLVQAEQTAPVGGDDLVDGVAKQESPVQH